MNNCRLLYLTRLRLLLFSWTVEQIFNAKMVKVGYCYNLNAFRHGMDGIHYQILYIDVSLKSINLH
jgi:hypothetical protein